MIEKQDNKADRVMANDAVRVQGEAHNLVLPTITLLSQTGQQEKSQFQPVNFCS